MRSLLVLLLVLLVQGPVAASVGTLKPEFSDDAMPLRSLALQALVQGPYVQTRATYEFDNAYGSQMEGVFHVQLPRGAVVTEFAYWFQGQKVPARIVDDERAELIFESIKSRQRDPALVKKLPGNRIRARIFPVAPEGVRVEIVTVEPLTASGGAWRWEFPRPELQGAPLPAEFRWSATVVPDEKLARVAGAPQGGRQDAAHQQGGRWVAEGDKGPVRLVLEPAKPGFAALAYGAPSGGNRAFFTATARTPVGLRNARVRLEGVAPSDTFGGRAAWLPAGSSLTLVGRSDTGRATIVLEGLDRGRWRRFAAPKTFVAKADPNHAGTKLWADPYLEALGRRAKASKSQAAVDRTVQLSMRFGVLSPFTSFLAVPESEWDAFYEGLRRRLDEFRWRAEYVERNSADAVARDFRTEPHLGWTEIPRGDPLIVVDAPRDARVTATFPDGSRRPLAWDGRRWALRFDIPMDAEDGAYVVVVHVVAADGARQVLTASFRVGGDPDEVVALSAAPGAPADPTGFGVTPPEPASAQAGSLLTWRVHAGARARRVVAAFPWGPVEMTLAGTDGTFRGAVLLPRDLPPGTLTVPVTVLDRAHRRAEVSLQVTVR